MTYTLKSIGFISAVKISAIVSAAVAVVPIIIFLLLNHFFKFWDVVIPPDLVGELLASAAFLGGAHRRHLDWHRGRHLQYQCQISSAASDLSSKPNIRPAKQKKKLRSISSASRHEHFAILIVHYTIR